MKGLEMNETIKIKVEFVAKNLDAVGQEVGANLLRQLAEENAKLREEVEDLNRENENLWHAQREGL